IYQMVNTGLFKQKKILKKIQMQSPHSVDGGSVQFLPSEDSHSAACFGPAVQLDKCHRDALNMLGLTHLSHDFFLSFLSIPSCLPGDICLLLTFSLSPPPPPFSLSAKEPPWEEEELKRRDTFYKEQLAKIEKKNSEIYKLTLDQYNEAVTNAEDQIRKRNTQAICANFQEAIMMCYNENKQQVLNCSDLVKEYQRCVRLAQKVSILLFLLYIKDIS
uniref:Coiled-coil-helix-coiled-coil-helix domain containing 6 n=1 Tax=Pseudonaja textilis TaxID=8673 RepID=A0A670XXV1_PSETE